MKKIAILCVAVTLIAAATGSYYFGGSSGSYLTQSYFLEKQLRDLLFFETHEPVEYPAVLVEYERLLNAIHFGTETNQLAIYRKAVARTELTIQILSHLQQYKTTQSHAELLKAHALYKQVFSRGLNEYDFYILYLKNERVTKEWFIDEIQKSEAKLL